MSSFHILAVVSSGVHTCPLRSRTVPSCISLALRKKAANPYMDKCRIAGVLCRLDDTRRMHGIPTIQSTNFSPGLDTFSRAYALNMSCRGVVSGCQGSYNLFEKRGLGRGCRSGWEEYASWVYNETKMSAYEMAIGLMHGTCNVQSE